MVQRKLSMPIDPKRGSGPRISVIVPVYNVEAYLRECLDSIVKQSLRDIEIICVNDASPDNSQEILNEYAKKDDRFIVINHKINKGLAGARNSGLNVASGDFIYFIDSDDLLANDDSLEIFYIRSIDDDSDEVVGGIVKWDQTTDEKYLDWHKHYLDKEVHGLPLYEIPQLYANVIACNKLIRRTLIENYSIRFNENIAKNEDNPFSVQVHVLSKRISILTDITYIYRQNSSSIMAKVKKSDALYRWMYCHDIIKFIEGDSKRHIFRKFYYPMYSGNLIEGASILSSFAPAENEKYELLLHWRESVDILPNNFPDIPPRQRMIFEYIKNDEMEKAWLSALDYVEQSSRIREKLVVDLARLKKLNKELSSQVETVYNSNSWRATAPLRAFFRFIRKSS